MNIFNLLLAQLVKYDVQLFIQLAK